LVISIIRLHRTFGSPFACPPSNLTFSQLCRREPATSRLLFNFQFFLAQLGNFHHSAPSNLRFSIVLDYSGSRRSNVRLELTGLSPTENPPPALRQT